MKTFLSAGIILACCLLSSCGGNDTANTTTKESGPTIARQWNEILLQAIRKDFARPTVHARNLFHMSAAMYDAWSAYATVETPYLLGKTVGGYSCAFNGIDIPQDAVSAREATISFAAYRMLTHRFRSSKAESITMYNAKKLMAHLGYDIALTSTDYSTGSAPALGNHIAECFIGFGLQDGSNEANAYANLNYSPVNPVIEPEFPGNPNIVDLNHWQAIQLSLFIDQSGNPIADAPDFLGPEWGRVQPFALSDADKTVYRRNNFDYPVYYDPGMPPTIDGPLSDEYKWNFTLVAIWSSHLDSSSDTMIDISPANKGNNNILTLPTSFVDFRNFYNLFEGGDISTGHALNPVTGAAYEPQIVRLGDYSRVLAEFWADGPDSETPPGHWFVLLNEINEHPLLERKFAGIGPEIEPLEWDIKAYFTLGGAMHDSAIAAWGIKGWYDYIRPVSAIRAMADRGQSSSPALPSYNVNGLPLFEGYIELVEAGDPLAGVNNINVGKVKLYAWRGPDFIDSPITDEAGVGWILAENWWPYQRPSFVTPPFAGYVSGHSTFSRAAAEVLTALTGSPYFPGGMGEFHLTANEFLVFEDGPSTDLILQWATYRDASDECSLSRIWGGIHPPADDLPGRLIGEKIGINSFVAARSYFEAR